MENNEIDPYSVSRANVFWIPCEYIFDEFRYHAALHVRQQKHPRTQNNNWYDIGLYTNIDMIRLRNDDNTEISHYL